MKIAKVGLYGFGSAAGLFMFMQESNPIFLLQFVGLALLAVLYGLKIHRNSTKPSGGAQ